MQTAQETVIHVPGTPEPGVSSQRENRHSDLGRPLPPLNSQVPMQEESACTRELQLSRGNQEVQGSTTALIRSQLSSTNIFGARQLTYIRDELKGVNEKLLKLDEAFRGTMRSQAAVIQQVVNFLLSIDGNIKLVAEKQPEESRGTDVRLHIFVWNWNRTFLKFQCSKKALTRLYYSLSDTGRCSVGCGKSPSHNL